MTLHELVSDDLTGHVKKQRIYHHSRQFHSTLEGSTSVLMRRMNFACSLKEGLYHTQYKFEWVTTLLMQFNSPSRPV